MRVIPVYLATSYFFPAHLLLLCTSMAISVLLLYFTTFLVLYVFSLWPLLLPLHKQNTAFNNWPSIDTWDWSSFSVMLIIESVFHCPLHKCIRSSLAPLGISMKLGTLTLQGLHVFTFPEHEKKFQEFLKIKEVYFSGNWEIHLMPIHSSWQHVCWATLLDTIQ